MTEPSQKVFSVCPECMQTISGILIEQEGEVVLVKNCSSHGEFRTTVWRGEPNFSSWVRPKIRYGGGARNARDLGCPNDCGLCHNHNQRTCTALVEITSRCNLRCPVCFADSGKSCHEPSLAEIYNTLQRVMERTGGCNLQLSGGEPTMRDDLETIVSMAKDIGFTFIQLNTNGLKLAVDNLFAGRLAKAGLSSVFLQFDGVNDDVFVQLRGRPLLAEKVAAIDHAARAGLGIVLVPTLVRGINTSQLWDIVSFALERAPAVRGVHFQPISYFGRYPADFLPDHFTLPEVMKALEIQSDEKLRVSDFHPPGCEHALCSFSSRYLIQQGGDLQLLGAGGQCDCTPKLALQGALSSIDATARQWQGVLPEHSEPADDELSSFIRQAGKARFQLSAMAFQDCWSLNLDRLQGCCIHVAQPDGRLIPFCSFNLTSRSGEALYRGKTSRTVQKTTVDELAARRLNLRPDWTRKELEAKQLESLRKTVDFARQNSSYYRETLCGIDAEEIKSATDLQKFPFLSSSDLVKDGERLQCVSASRVERIMTMQTSGSTGQPKRLMFSAADLDSIRDFFYHGMKSLVGDDGCVLVMLPYTQPASTGELLIRALSDQGIHAEGAWPPSTDSAEIIRKKRITCVVGLPQHLLGLAERLGSGFLRSILLCSDYASPVLRRRIEQLTGAETFLHYGTTESGLGGGVECGLHQGCHLRESELLVEIIDPVTQMPVADGELGEIVLTTLGREAMVLLRYRTGDLARLDRGRCACGGGTARLFDIRGRLEGCLVGEYTLYTQQIDDALFAIDGLIDYRMVIEGGDAAIIKIEYLASESACDTAEKVTAKLRAVPAVRQAVKSGSLIIGEVAAVGGFAPGHTVKRMILDLR